MSDPIREDAEAFVVISNDSDLKEPIRMDRQAAFAASQPGHERGLPEGSPAPYGVLHYSIVCGFR